MSAAGVALKKLMVSAAAAAAAVAAAAAAEGSSSSSELLRSRAGGLWWCTHTRMAREEGASFLGSKGRAMVTEFVSSYVASLNHFQW